jgi:hypothetical protein
MNSNSQFGLNGGKKPKSRSPGRGTELAGGAAHKKPGPKKGSQNKKSPSRKSPSRKSPGKRKA